MANKLSQNDKDRNLLTVYTLVKRALDSARDGFDSIERQTSTGSIADKTGCCLNYLDMASRFIEIKTLLGRAFEIVSVDWNAAISRVEKEIYDGK